MDIIPFASTILDQLPFESYRWVWTSLKAPLRECDAIAKFECTYYGNIIFMCVAYDEAVILPVRIKGGSDLPGRCFDLADPNSLGEIAAWIERVQPVF